MASGANALPGESASRAKLTQVAVAIGSVLGKADSAAHKGVLIVKGEPVATATRSRTPSVKTRMFDGWPPLPEKGSPPKTSIPRYRGIVGAQKEFFASTLEWRFSGPSASERSR